MANRLTRGRALVGSIKQRYSHATAKVAKVALAGGGTNDFAFAWKNPERSDIIVARVLVDITTKGGTATAVLNVGTADDAATGSDNLINGLDANATGLFDNITDNGTNGKSRQRLAVGKFITGQIATEDAGDLAGNVYIEYFLV